MICGGLLCLATENRFGVLFIQISWVTFITCEPETVLFTRRLYVQSSQNSCKTLSSYVSCHDRYNCRLYFCQKRSKIFWKLPHLPDLWRTTYVSAGSRKTSDTCVCASVHALSCYVKRRRPFYYSSSPSCILFFSIHTQQSLSFFPFFQYELNERIHANTFSCHSQLASHILVLSLPTAVRFFIDHPDVLITQKISVCIKLAFISLIKDHFNSCLTEKQESEWRNGRLFFRYLVKFVHCFDRKSQNNAIRTNLNRLILTISLSDPNVFFFVCYLYQCFLTYFLNNKWSWTVSENPWTSSSRKTKNLFECRK